MISSYLSLLYSNCRVFRKSDAYNWEELNYFFENKIQTTLIANNLKSEEDLVQLLISKSYSNVKKILDDSNYIYIFYYKCIYIIKRDVSIKNTS